MTIEEIERLYQPSKDQNERMALKELINVVVRDSKNATLISNALFRNGIKSIEKLHKTNEEELIKIRNIGLDRIGKIMAVKLAIITLLETD